MDIANRIDPEHVYVENIRQLFSVPHWLALRICEAAAREGVFEKRRVYLCPNDETVILTLPAEQEAGESTVCCPRCELMEREPDCFNAQDLDSMVTFRVPPGVVHG